MIICYSVNRNCEKTVVRFYGMFLCIFSCKLVFLFKKRSLQFHFIRRQVRNILYSNLVLSTSITKANPMDMYQMSFGRIDASEERKWYLCKHSKDDHRSIQASISLVFRIKVQMKIEIWPNRFSSKHFFQIKKRMTYLFS